MSSNDKKRYYWFKLPKNFFKKHDIRIIESMPNGKDYILFYLKLLCESTSHEGNLRFSEQVPYNEQMLSVITDTNIDTVHQAIQLFIQLDMIELHEDGTYYMKNISNMIGSETGRTIRYNRLKGKVGANFALEKEIEKEIELDKEKGGRAENSIKPKDGASI